MAILQDITIGQMLRESAVRFPDEPAIECSGRIWTYREMDKAVDILAVRLLEKGVRKGDHTAFLYGLDPTAVMLFYAAARIGAVSVLLNSCLPDADLVDLIQRTDSSYLLAKSSTMEKRKGMKVLSGVKVLKDLGQEGQCEEPVSREALVKAQAAVTSEDSAVIIFTSGTTSKPKGVVTDHFSRVNNAIQEAEDMGLTCKDKICVATPMFHCFALSACVLAAVSRGACLYLPEKRHTADFLKAVSLHRCTVLSGVPTLFHALISRTDLGDWDLSSLRTGIIGGSYCSPELFCRIEETLRIRLLSSLGQTEGTGGITSTCIEDPLEIRMKTVGRFMPHTEGKTVEPLSGRTLNTGEAGEICVRGYLVMKEYYGQPEETAKAIDADGWLHTGDLGYIDEEGNVHLTGRLKELIIRAGENISPEEVERAALADSRILYCKAVGVPDEHYGEEVCLFLQFREGETASEEEIRAMLKGKLPSYKVPRYLRFVETMPVSSTGKIQAKELMKLLL